jgi:diguanylate cyclase (GGDEF)-like protein/PAS domain S-box-containing protein
MSETPIHAVSRLVSIGLVGILLFMAGFAVVAGRESTRAANLATAESLRAESYRDLQEDITQELSLQTRYWTRSSRDTTKVAFQIAVAQVRDSLRAEAQQEDPRLLPVIHRLQKQQDTYTANVYHFFTLFDIGDAPIAGANQAAVLDPLRRSMTRAISYTARHEAAMARSALGHLTDTERTVRLTSILVSVAGLLLAGFLVIALERFQRRRNAEHRALAISEERYRRLVETSPDAILLANLRGTILTANPAAAELYGYGSPMELLGVNALTLTAPEEHQRLAAEIAQTAQRERGRSEINEYQQVRKDGSHFPAETRAAVVQTQGDSAKAFLVTVRDISARRQAEEAARQLAAIVEASSDAITGTTPDGILTSWNASAEQLYGYAEIEAVGQPYSMLIPPDRLAERARLTHHVEEGLPVRHFETVRLRKDGQRFDASISISPVRDAQGKIAGYAVTTFDITQHKAFEEQLKHQAFHDALTGLPNRSLFYDRLEQTMRAAHRDDAPMALLLLDLDRFKQVNDSLGHHAGDMLLLEFAARLERTLRDSDTVARLGGDEFAIILPTVDQFQTDAIVEKIQTALRLPLILEGHRIDVESSVGVALYPAHGNDSTTLLRRADVAMYTAKRSGEGHRTYDPSLDLNSSLHLNLVADLRAAIDHDELVLHYQPKVNVRTGAAEHMEALVRWQHPDHGLIPPSEFIALAEETGLIEPLTLWVLKTALAQCAEWQRIGLGLSVAVNLSARNLPDPRLPDTIAWLLRSAGVKASMLILEITESSLMGQPDEALKVLTRLHAMGVKISIDDFGTGYSSLAYLKQLPVDEIKIDRSFVLGMSQNGTVIVRSVIELGRNLGLEVTAEGVEDEEMLDKLARMGCGTAQGFYFSRPLPASDITAWMLARNQKGTSTSAGQEAILVVDDNPVYQELVQLLLSDEGYKVTTTGSAEEALLALEGMTPNVVLTDVHLPGMSGLEFVRQMRSQPQLRDTVIVAITNAPRTEDKQYALSVGCDVYAAKPSKNRDVVQLVREHMHTVLRPSVQR